MTPSPKQLFNALAHPLRLRAALLLRDQGELCVCELTHVLATQQPVVSRHLGQMRRVGLVTSRRAGTWIHYRLADDLPAWADQVLAATATAACDHAADRHSLAAMADRPGHAC